MVSATKATAVRLRDIAHGRSGDKGNHANIGIIAYSEEGYRFLLRELTEEKVAAYFSKLPVTKVQRFELPGIQGVNFLLHDALAGGGSRSLRIDSQGKTLALALLELPLEETEEVSQLSKEASALRSAM